MERFTKVKNVGKGNMGTCALVRNNEDGRHYVIKQVDLAKLNKKERAQSLNEAKVLSVLRHPNVINYVDSFLARKTDHLCIVMEYADGGDLGIKIKNAHGVNFSEDQVLDFLVQMVLSLMHIHSRHILHRDIKTANFFLTADGLLKLGDFGIARALDSTVDHAQTFVGTPYYLSPELILEKPYDLQSDVWAFGVCLYELMALKHPFNAGDMKTLMQKILRVQYDPLPGCYSAELRGLVARILVKEPSQRMKLQDILKMPMVVDRIRKWIAGGVLPPRYIAALIRFKLLPGFENAMGPGGNQFTTTNANTNGNNNNNNGTNLPAINNPQSNNMRAHADTSALGRYASNPTPNGYPQPLTARTNSTSLVQQDTFLASLPSSSHSNAPPPFTSRPPNNNNNNNNNLGLVGGGGGGGGGAPLGSNQNLANAAPRTNLPPLGNLGAGGGAGKLPMPPPPQSGLGVNNMNNNNNNIQRKNSFSFPAPPPIPRQNNSNININNNNNNNNANPYQHHNQFSQQQQQQQPGGAGLLRKASAVGFMQGNNKPQNQSTFPALPKLPGLPILPALGRPQPGSI